MADFFHFSKTTPELSFPTAFHVLSILPCPHMARWAKKGEGTGGWQNWNEAMEGEAWQLHHEAAHAWNLNKRQTKTQNLALRVYMDNLRGNEQRLTTLTRERHQNRNIHNCWFHLPWPANPKQERNGINYKRTVQDAGWNPKVWTYRLWLRKGLPLSVLTSYFLQ